LSEYAKASDIYNEHNKIFDKIATERVKVSEMFSEAKRKHLEAGKKLLVADSEYTKAQVIFSEGLSQFAKDLAEYEKAVANNNIQSLSAEATPRHTELVSASPITKTKDPETNPVKEKEDIEFLVLAESRLSILDGDYEIIRKFKGEDLIGTTYEQILPYCKINSKEHKEALSILPGDFVTTTDGSGIVHLAPAFGEDDYQMFLKYNIPFLQPVTPDGHFTEEVKEFAGRAIKTFKYEDRVEEGADKDIIIRLKQLGKIYRTSNDYVHNYPHC